MIDSKNILVKDDTALVLLPSLPNTLEENKSWWLKANRPCFTCGGSGQIPFMPRNRVCPDCDGTGRHTFDIEVERDDVPVTPYPESRNPFGDRPRLGPQDCAHFEDCEMYEGDKRCRYAGCSYDFTRGFRVHVIDVLSIYGEDHASLDIAPCIVMWGDGTATYHENDDQWCYITLPPNAAPGMFLVRLAVHS